MNERNKYALYGIGCLIIALLILGISGMAMRDDNPYTYYQDESAGNSPVPGIIGFVFLILMGVCFYKAFKAKPTTTTNTLTK
jgi:hypothetical protein